MWKKEPEVIRPPINVAQPPQGKQKAHWSLLSIQCLLAVVLLAVCLLAAYVGPFDIQNCKQEYLTYLTTGVPMSCEDQIILFAGKSLDTAQASLKGLAAKLEGKMLAMGGEYEITHASYLKTVTLASYSISDQPFMPVNGVLTSGFGYRTHPITGKEDFHTGVDLAAAKGTPVQAAYYGVVAETGVNDINGNYVMVVHSSNVCTVYCHLDTIGVKAGQRLNRGDVLGTVGETGMATGPHLHFELLINGVRVDPAFALKL